MTPRIPPMTTPVAGEGDDEDARPINSLWYRYLQALQQQIAGAGIPDAPDDGLIYGRKNLQWQSVTDFTETSAGLVPAPGVLSNKVLRDDGTWVAQSIVSPALPAFAVQYNNGGAFGGSGRFTFDGSTATLIDGARLVINRNSATPTATPIASIGSQNGFGLYIEAGKYDSAPYYPSLSLNDIGNPNNPAMKFFTGPSASIETRPGIGLRVYAQAGTEAILGLYQGAFLSTNMRFGVWDAYTATAHPVIISKSAIFGSMSIGSTESLNVRDGKAKFAIASGYSSINLPHASTAVTSLSDGDVWTDASGFYARINGTTYNLLTPTAGAGGSNTQVQYNNSGTLAGSASFTWNNGTGTLSATNYSGTTGTFSGLLATAASAAGGAGFRLPHGAAPTAPTNGDVWTTTLGIYAQINGVTVGPLSAGGTGAPGGANTQIQFNNAGTFGASANFTFNSVSNLLTVTGNANVTGTARIGSSGTATNPLEVIGSGATDMIYVRNTSASGYSGVQLQDSAAAFQGAFGFGNSSASDLDLRGRVYVVVGSTNFIHKSNGAIRSTLFASSGNYRFGSSTTDPGVPFQVDGTAVFASANPIRTGSATLIQSTVAFTNGAGANTATLTNSPVTGNPTKWIPINDNGTTRYIPAW